MVVTAGLISSSSVYGQEIFEAQGLEQIKEIVLTDTLIAKKVDQSKIPSAINSIEKMNTLIKKAVYELGLANDGTISTADARDINKYLSIYHEREWRQLRGKSARENSTGYSIVDNRSVRTETKIFNIPASRVWAGIYNIGFETDHKNNLTDAIGKKSISFSSVGYYLGEIMKEDIANGGLANQEYKEVVGETGTKLDFIVKTIFNDEGLLKRISMEDMREGASSANEMNALILEAIYEEGLANDKRLTAADMRTVNMYLVENHEERWKELHGDDENSEETGYHSVQNDGAYSRLFADNVINSIADGIYHLGFYTDQKNRLLNEDGNKNKSFEKVAWWLDTILKDDLEAEKLSNLEYTEVEGTTGTILDKIIPYIYNDEGLALNVSMEDIREASKSANEMNKLIVEAIRMTDVASDDYISVDEVKLLNKYLVENHASRWIELHGDDEGDIETGYHRIQNNGSKGTVYNKNLINKLADGIYHLGFYTEDDKRLVNEDGNKNVSFLNVSYWMNKSFQEDYAKGTLK